MAALREFATWITNCLLIYSVICVGSVKAQSKYFSILLHHHHHHHHHFSFVVIESIVEKNGRMMKKKQDEK